MCPETVSRHKTTIQDLLDNNRDKKNLNVQYLNEGLKEVASIRVCVYIHSVKSKTTFLGESLLPFFERCLEENYT